MKILFLGDIVGRPGRKTVREILPLVQQEKKPDITIANVENLAGGKGINEKTLKEMQRLDIAAFTGGNHIFKHPEGVEVLRKGIIPVVIPANFPPGAPGKRWHIAETKNGKRVLIICLLGRTFMSQKVDCPFRTVEALLNEIDPDSYDASIVDIHAEATSEKYALRWFLDGKVSAVLGTHTHVPTADADVTPTGTAFQCDVGMNGSLDSCIGVKKEQIVEVLISQMPTTFELERKGRMQFNAALIETKNGGEAKKISSIRKIIG